MFADIIKKKKQTEYAHKIDELEPGKHIQTETHTRNHYGTSNNCSSFAIYDL